MADRGLHLDQETFSCSICLDLLEDPVTIPCGHSYCMSCVNTHWDGEMCKQSYSCPQCRQSFTQRPVLVKNTMLAALVEELNGLPPAPAHHCYAGPEDVACDMCSGRKLKAAKSCLQCLVSYCEDHLQPHYDVAALKKHKLIDPTENLLDNICPRHNEVMKMFCRTDQQCICYLCSVEEHKGHDTLSAATERNEMQRILEDSRLKTRQLIQDKQKDIDALQHGSDGVRHSADRVVEESERIFTQISRLVERRRTEVRRKIRSQQETEERRVKELQDKLQMEITRLKRKYNELERLSQTEDHNQFLHTFPSLFKLSETLDSSSSETTPLSFIDVLTAAVAELRDKLRDTSLLDEPTDETEEDTEPASEEDILHAETWPALHQVEMHSQVDTEEWLALPRVNFPVQLANGFHPEPLDTLLIQPVTVVQPQNDPTLRAELLTHASNITLDPNTPHSLLSLSTENNIVRYMNHDQEHCDHPERFTDFAQVLSKETLTGRSYLEVKGRFEDYFSVAVVYKDIRREGASDECSFGNNTKSWALDCYKDGYVFWCNRVSTTITAPFSNKIGIFVDYEAGVLSFYSVAQEMTLIHRVQTTFTQPLLAGIWLKDVADCAEICSLR